MTALEVFLIITGIVCIVISLAAGGKKDDDKALSSEGSSAELTNRQKDEIRRQINDIIDEELDGISERTEASLDKISNTKILEMSEYAENVLGEINRNHNETVFLYDMLNEKAKEVKSTVKDVNITKKQVEKIHDSMKASDKTKSGKENKPLISSNEASGDTFDKQQRPTRDIAKERLIELVRQNNEKRRNTEQSNHNQAEEIAATMESASAKELNTSGAPKKSAAGKQKADMTTKKSGRANAAGENIQFEKGVSGNDKILELHKLGMTNKDIARQLNLGVGEVKLVIDLYKG